MATRTPLIKANRMGVALIFLANGNAEISALPRELHYHHLSRQVRRSAVDIGWARSSVIRSSPFDISGGNLTGMALFDICSPHKESIRVP